jgi:hypothetical protein
LLDLQILFLRAARVVDDRSLDLPMPLRGLIASKLEKSGVLPCSARAMNVRYFGLSLNVAARPNAGQDPRRCVYDMERPIKLSCSTQHVQPRDGR